MIKRILENLLGIYRLNEWSNDDFIAASRPANVEYMFTNSFYVNIPQGLTRYTQNNPQIVICRTHLGKLFPSLRYVSLEDGPVLRPDRIRRASGYFIVAFLILSLFAMAGIFFQYPIEFAPKILAFCSLFGGLLCLMVWLGTKLELSLLTQGIREFISK